MSKDRDLVRRGKDSADVDDTASDADKKAAMKNIAEKLGENYAKFVDKNCFLILY